MAWYQEADLQRARAEGWEEGKRSGARWGGQMFDPYGVDPPINNPYNSERDGEKRYNVPCCWGKACTTDIERIGDAWFRISNGDRYNLPVED